MDEEIQQPEPKISDVEIILIGLFYLIIDLIDLIPIAGDITDIIVAPMGFYYWMKGLNGTTFIVSEIIELIPVLQEIPTRVIGWGITVYIDRHPKLEAAIGTATKVAGALEGDVGGAEGAAGEAAQGTVAQGGATISQGETASTDARVPAAEGAPATQQENGSGANESGAVTPGETKSGNARPSETSTERGGIHGGESERGGDAAEGETQPTTQEARRKEAADEADKEMTPKAERDPIDVAEEEEFGDRAASRQPPNPPEPKAGQSSDQKKLDERWTRNQEKVQKQKEAREEFQKLKQPSVATGDDEEDEDDYKLPKAA